MATVVKRKKIRKNPTVFHSIAVAAFGLLLAIRQEGSIRKIIVTAILAMAGSIWAGAGYLEVMLLIFSWMIVTAFEIFNTALEKAMDYASDKEYHPLIKKGKDFAGASVFLASSFALAFTALVIFKNLNGIEIQGE